MKTAKKIVVLALGVLVLFSCHKKKIMNEPGNLVPKTVDQDPALPSITVNGAMLHAQAFGPRDSTLIVCLHGGPGSDYRSLLNCADLATYGYRVVFYDQRGSGLSQRFPKDFYISAGADAVQIMLDDLSGVIAHYKTKPGQKVILFGNSWGGILATAYAGKYPDTIHGLMVCDPGGLKWDDITEYIKTSLAFPITGELMNNVTYLDQFITGKRDQHEILDYKLAMAAGDNPITGEINTAPESFWRSGAVIMDALLEIGKKHKPDFSSGIHNFNRPVLFLYSELNRAYPPSWAARVSGAYNSAELYRVMGAGHTSVITDKKIWSDITRPKMLTYLKSL